MRSRKKRGIATTSRVISSLAPRWTVPTAADPGFQSRSPRHRSLARTLGRSRRTHERDLEWRTRCANAKEVKGRGGCALLSLGTALLSLGTYVYRDAPRP